MHKVTICIPSNRSLDRSRKSIDSVLNFVAGSDIEVVISDNSNDQTKPAYIKSLHHPHLKYLQGPPAAFANWKNAVNEASGQYVVVVSDDDIIISVSNTPFEKLRASQEEIVGARPGFVIFNEKMGLLKTTNFGIDGATATDRVKEYFEKAQGMNSTLFSAWRKDVLVGVYDAFLHHPTQGEYADWSIVMALLSSGPVINEPSTIFFYNNQNWSGDQEFINNAVSKLFVNAGLLPSDSKYLPLLKAIDSYILIRRLNSPAPVEQTQMASRLALTVYLKSFIELSEKSKQTGLDRYLIQDLKNAKTVKDFFNSSKPILANIGLLEKYEKFYLNVIGQVWGM